MVNLRRIDPTGRDREDLISFLTRNDFPFHVRTSRTAAEVAESIDAGAYRSDECDSFWLDDDERGVIGMVLLEDLEDPTPLIDVRLAGTHRGHGLGAPALEAITAHVFETMPEVHRLEGQTREDNAPMRRVFLRCGWVKEAHYRESWPVDGGDPVASVAYAVLRRDWESGTVTTFVWEDLTL